MSIQADMEAPWKGWSIVGEPERGAYGGVYEIRPEDGGPHRAMKVVEVPNRLAMREANEPMPKSKEELEGKWKAAREKAREEYDHMHEVQDRHVVESDAVCYDVHEDGDGTFSYRVFIRMELLEPLLEWLEENPADDVTVARIGRDAALGLAACEREGVLHRDIKPANILVKPDRRASDAVFKLGDFGIAREDADTHDLTQVWTPAYVAPEACNSRTYDNRSDIYSLGLTLHFILNGKTQALPVESRLKGEPMPRPASGSDDLVRIVLKACAFHPKDRYQHAQDMADDLDAFLHAREGGTTKPMTQWNEGGENQTMPPKAGGMNVYAMLTDGGRTLEFAQTDSGLGAGMKVMFVAHDCSMVSGTILPWLEGMVPSGSSPFSKAAPTVEKVIFHDRVRPASTHRWFENFINLKSIEGIELLDTSSVTDMACMFYDCSSLVSINLSHFDTSSVEDMSGMFKGCSSISSLDVSRFDISKALSLTDMFCRCSSLSSLTIASYSQLEKFKALVPSGCQFRTRDGIVVEPFRFIRSDIYMPDGIDFRGTLEIKRSELGGPKRIPMPDGSTVYFDVPAHLKSGTTHRFANQGAPDPDRLGSRGSAYVTLNIKKEKQQKRSTAPHPQQKSNTGLRSQTKRQSGHKGISRRAAVLCGLAAAAGGIALAASRGTDLIGSALSFLGTSPSSPASKATVPYPSAAIVEANVPSHACIDGNTLAYLDGYGAEGYPTSIRLVDLDGTDDRELLHIDKGMLSLIAAADDHVFYISYSYTTHGHVWYDLHSVDEAYSDDQTIWSYNMGDAIGDSDWSFCAVRLFMQQGMLYVAPRWGLKGDSPSFSQWLVMVSPDGSKTQGIIPMTSYDLSEDSAILGFRLYDGSLYTLGADEEGTAVLCRQGFGDASYTEICRAEGSWDDRILEFFDGKIGLDLHSSSEDAWTCCTMLPDGSDLQQTDWDALASGLDAAGVRSKDYGWLIGKGDDDRLAYLRLQDSSRIYASIDLYGESETDLATVTTSS